MQRIGSSRAVGTSSECGATEGYCAEDAKGLRAETSGYPMPAAHTVKSEARLDGVTATTAEVTQQVQILPVTTTPHSEE